MNDFSRFEFALFLPQKQEDLDFFLKNKAKEDTCNASKNFINHRWRVIWLIATAPFRIILEILFEAISHLSSCIGAQNLAIRCFIFAQHLRLDIKAIADYFQYGDHLLVHTRNVHKIDPPIYLLENPLTPDRPFTLYNPKGICWGGDNWFTYLLKINSPSLLANERETICKLAQIFSEGVPEAGSILQSLMNIRKRALEREFDIPLHSYLNTHIKTVEAIHSLGCFWHKIKIYFQKAGGHEVLILKKSNEHLYLLDLNVGLLEWKGSSAALEIHDYLKRYHYKIDKKNPPEHGLVSEKVPVYSDLKQP